MPRRPTVTQADMTRALKAARDAGLAVSACILTPQQAVIKFGDEIPVDPEITTPENPQPKQWQ